MIFATTQDHLAGGPLREAMARAYRQDETECVEALLPLAQFSEADNQAIKDRARTFVLGVRERREAQGAMDHLMKKYDLSSEEGVALMCLAEALLRIPDAHTVNKLLSDKIGPANWKKHLGGDERFFVNAMTWSLMMTGKIFASDDDEDSKFGTALSRLFQRLGGPAIRAASKKMMEQMGKLFVMGSTIENAIKRAEPHEQQGYLYSYDMLGEAAYTQADAERYFKHYEHAIHNIGVGARGKNPIESSNISVKLSALHPRYKISKRDRVLQELVPRLLDLALLAKKYNIGLTVDAEESERLDLSLDVIEAVLMNESLQGWDGLGLAVQAYQKRAIYVIDVVVDLAKRSGHRIMIRLVKGAYWDSEIKWTQELGLNSYPVFTRKHSTDVSYLACAKKMLQNTAFIYPSFATHNARTMASILQLTKENRDFEFQCLHGMGQTLYDQIIQDHRVRIYAPVGGYEELLPYLVRRLLENGANTSFVNLIANESLNIDDVIADPVAHVAALHNKPHPQIPLPKNLYKNRINSGGLDMTNKKTLEECAQAMQQAVKPWKSAPFIGGQEMLGEARDVCSPIDGRVVGTAVRASVEMADEAIHFAHTAFQEWSCRSVEERAACLDRAADLLEERMPMFMAMASLEAGKTLSDGISEVREAADFCRYYAMIAREKLKTQHLPGPTGESNQLEYVGRGVIACISPWNFPLAIFMGQVTAALVAGNTVIAKPAEQTSLIGMAAVKLLHEAGVPKNVLQLLPGSGRTVGMRLVQDERVKGIIFTGSTETARVINQALAQREGAIVPLIAETGGQNAMIVDSSALPEQVVNDALISAFGSAGQRCSALRVLFLQEDIADKVINMLVGAMKELTLGDPTLLKTDIGPVIDQAALEMLNAHVERMKKEATILYQMEIPAGLSGSFFAPCAVELKSISQLTREVFGPILHIVRFKATELDRVIDDINNTGYGLTFGIHSRVTQTVKDIHSKVAAGNTYVNRNMVGAVVGVQPFGGEGLSGTGPKAGGPNYIMRLVNERTLTINTTAAGGNASLLCLTETD